MHRIGVTELVLILVIALVIFGPSKLPEIGKSIGQSINEFKKGMNEASSDDTKAESQDQDKDHIEEKDKETENKD